MHSPAWRFDLDYIADGNITSKAALWLGQVDKQAGRYTGGLSRRGRQGEAPAKQEVSFARPVRACALEGDAASRIFSRGGGTRACRGAYRRRTELRRSVGRPPRVRHVATPNTATSQVAASPDHEKRSVGRRRRRPPPRDTVAATVIVRVRITAPVAVPEIKTGKPENRRRIAVAAKKSRHED